MLGLRYEWWRCLQPTFKWFGNRVCVGGVSVCMCMCMCGVCVCICVCVRERASMCGVFWCDSCTRSILGSVYNMVHEGTR